MNGYIKLYRSLMDNPFWTEKPFSRGQAWVDLLMLANWKESRKLTGGEVVTIHEGEINVSQLWLADRWGWDRKKVARFLARLERDQMVAVNGTTRGTSLTIEKYSKYQGDGATERATDDQPTTNQRPTDDHILRKKEIKKEKIKREIREKNDDDLFQQQHEQFADIKAMLAAEGTTAAKEERQ